MKGNFADAPAASRCSLAALGRASTSLPAALLKIRRYLVPWGFDSPSRHQLKSSSASNLQIAAETAAPVPPRARQERGSLSRLNDGGRGVPARWIVPAIEPSSVTTPEVNWQLWLLNTKLGCKKSVPRCNQSTCQWKSGRTLGSSISNGNIQLARHRETPQPKQIGSGGFSRIRLLDKDAPKLRTAGCQRGTKGRASRYDELGS